MKPHLTTRESQPAPGQASHASSGQIYVDDGNLARQIVFCLNGDQKAWEYLVEISHSLVYLICYEFLGSHAEAEDLTQDVFMKVYCNLHRFDPEKGTFRNWLRNVTRNYLVDRYRRTRLARLSISLDELVSAPNSGPIVASLLTDARPSQEDQLIASEERAKVHDALDQLSPAARDTVKLCLLDERTHKDAADVLGVAEGTIKSRLSRARAELAQLLRPLQLVQS
jgi:RNA polymerase sigma-70 factor, ECF subfamily